MMKLLVLILIYIKENVCILYKEKYQNYRVMNYYKDVTILLNGLEYHQHKVFMANSLFFDKLFKSNPTNSYFELYLPITTEMFKIIIKILYSNGSYENELNKLSDSQMFELYNACYYLEIRRNFITKQKQKSHVRHKKLLGIIKKNCELVDDDDEIYNPCVYQINKRIGYILTQTINKKNKLLFNNIVNNIIKLNCDSFSRDIKIYKIIMGFVKFNLNLDIKESINRSLIEFIYRKRLDYFDEDVLIKESYRLFLQDLPNKLISYQEEFNDI